MLRCLATRQSAAVPLIAVNRSMSTGRRSGSKLVGVRAAFWRGGTSKSVFFRRQDLPARREDWSELFLSALGSPDPHARQLDGMGGGLSSVSKVVVIEASQREDADIDYTFVQIGVKNPVVDYSSQCGNLVSAVGPVAVDWQLPHAIEAGNALVRVFNTNTSKIVHCRFPIGEDGQLAIDGDLTIDGVPGTAARIICDYVEPGGSRTAGFLPTGQAVDVLDVPEVGQIKASLVDCGNPVVFVTAKSMGVEDPSIRPDDIAVQSDLLARLEAIRQVGAVQMGLCAARNETPLAVPKICMVASVGEAQADDGDIIIRTISSKDPHKAIPMTVALCSAAAARVPGSLVQACVKDKELVDDLGVTLLHPSGKIAVSATVHQRDGKLAVTAGTVYRTARKLFEGQVFAKLSTALAPQG